ILNLLPRTDFDFVNIATGASKTVRIWLAQNIDASQYREAILAARIHAANVQGTGTSPSMALDLVPVAPTNEDPAPGAGAGFFRDSSKLTLTMYSATPVATPALKTSAMSGPFYGLLSLQMTVTQWGTTCSFHTFTISVDLNLKS
ncbi:MAG: hypothetical protein K8H88_19820, partial [Sandaracinaceae bacterium]|nr:hypothetical protein [Sandaracinaceae bacterium]